MGTKENLEFKEDYLESEESGFMYIELDKPQTIIFSTTENMGVINLPAFISPPISRLSISDRPDIPEEKKISKWIIFVIVLGILILMSIIVYVILQR